MNQLAIGLLIPLFLLGCAFDVADEQPDLDEEMLGMVEDKLNTENAMEPNALNPNGIYANGIYANGIYANALTPTALPASAMSALRDTGSAGDLSRMLMKYLVSCSLENTQSFTLKWPDAVNGPNSATYWGSLGLAPTWSAEPLGATDQRWVSACVAARVNRYGISVLISMRGTNPRLGFDSNERTNYAKQEGVFWGNLFADPPVMKTCYNYNNRANSRSKNRACAAGQDDSFSDCGSLVIVGDCQAVCNDRVTTPTDDPDDGFESCQGATEVITSFLP